MSPSNARAQTKCQPPGGQPLFRDASRTFEIIFSCEASALAPMSEPGELHHVRKMCSSVAQAHSQLEGRASCPPRKKKVGMKVDWGVYRGCWPLGYL